MTSYSSTPICLAFALVGCLGLMPAQAADPSAPPDAETVRAFLFDQKLGEGDFAPARQAGEDWSRAKQLSRDPRWAKWLAKISGALDEWMKAPHDDPTWVAGWQHDYIDRRSGAFVPWRPTSPRPAASDDPKFERAWVAHNRNYNMQKMLDAARLFALSGEGRYQAWAADQLDAYAEAYQNLPLQTWNGQARLFTQSLDEAIRVFDLADIVRLIRPGLAPERIVRWRDKLFLPLAENLQRSYNGVNNISVWRAAAISVIGYEFDQPALVTSGLDSDIGLRRLLAQGVSPDFYWIEGSLSYQEYVVQALNQFFIALSVRGKLAPLKQELWIAQNLALAPLRVRFSTEQPPNIGDTPPNRSTPNNGLLRQIRRVFPTALGMFAARNKLEWDNLLDPPTTATPPPLPEVASARIDGLSAAQLKTPTWQAFLRYGQRTPFHAHQDGLGIELQYKTTWVLRDPGTVGYGSPLHQDYFRRALAHNVPLVNGDGQDPWPAQGVLDEFNAATPAASASFARYRGPVGVKRSLRVERDTLKDRMTFTAPDTTERDLGFVLNSPCAITTPLAQAPADTPLPKSGAFRFWKNTHAYRAEATWRAQLNCRDQNFDLRVSGPAAQTVFIGHAPDSQKPGVRAAIYVMARARAATFDLEITPTATPAP